MFLREPKEALKRRFPGLVPVVRGLGRFRFLLKLRQVRGEGVRFRDDPLNVARFVLLDPETHSYTYHLANADELGPFLSRLTALPADEIAGYVEEVAEDPELGERLSRRVRWRIDSKRELPLGNRLLWYALVRAVKPRLVVETGIHHGLGSLVLLRALERNGQGELISFDLDPASGWLVPERLRSRWRPVFGDIERRLDEELTGRRVDVFVHESSHDEALQRIEFAAALAHAADELYVVDSSGFEVGVLAQLCRAHEAEHELFVERPMRHFYRPVGTAVARFGPPPAAARFERAGAQPEVRV
jgi:hypothetical protein